MIRRTFIHKFSFALSIGALFPFNVLSKNKFKLNYAPHLGMFKNNVGDDPIDQINYMADLGFRAFETNPNGVGNLKQCLSDFTGKFQPKNTN